MPCIAHEDLIKILDYCPDSGAFTRKVKKGNCRAGETVGTIRAGGYSYINLNYSRYLAHRLAWFYVYGEWPKGQIDHINGIRTDNRLSNIRDVPPLINRQNERKPRKNNSSGYLGVAKVNKAGKIVYRATIRLHPNRKVLGDFDNPIEASNAYLEAKRKLHIGCTI